MKELLLHIESFLENSSSKELPSTIRGILVATAEELRIEIYHKENSSTILKKAREMSNAIKNIQLGCGKHLLKNYINIDILPDADIIWDIRKGLPFEDDSINQVFSEHTLKHLDYPISTNLVLSETYRILAPGGTVIIGVPDYDFPLSDIFNKNTKNMEVAKEKWYKNRPDVLNSMEGSFDYLNFVMRDQLFHEHFHPHYWGWNEMSLKKLLEKHNFTNIKKWNINDEIINPKRKWGTIYIEATK